MNALSQPTAEIAPSPSPLTLPPRGPRARTDVFSFGALETELTEAPDRAALFADPQFQARLSARIADVARGRPILSFDVFDTLLLRDRSSELTRFAEIGARMAELAAEATGRPISAADGLVARHLGTKATYRAAPTAQGCREGSLTELHRTASRLLVGDDRLADAFIDAELDYEAARLSPNLALLEELDRARAAGGCAILITDMYMHAHQVARLLERHGMPAERYDLLVSSADTRVSKASGKIFPLVEERMGAGPDAFCHLGDSRRGDFSQAIARGWAALHLPLAKADIDARRADHLATAAALAKGHGLHLDVALPH